MRIASVLFVSAFLCLAVTSSAHASFHLMRITEVMGQYHGDPRIQYVELQMTSPGQNFVQGHKLVFQDAAGAKTGEVTFGANVASSAAGSNILVGTAAFATAFGVAVDLVLPEGLLSPYSGRVCFDTQPVDCVAYGAFTGSNTSFGTPAAGFPVDAGESLTLLSVTPPGPGRNNSQNYAFRPPTPRNNGGSAGAAPPHACFIADPLNDMSKWDQPTEGAGLDLNSCGTPAALDIGFADAAGGVLSLQPGDFDFPDIGPLGITGLSNAATKTIPDQNYRVKFDMLANPGIAVGAAFVRQHHFFDDGAGTIDIGQGYGLGLNFSFDDLNNEPSDHAHGDQRTNCFQDPNIDNEDTAPFADFKMTSDTPYTVVMDVDGDDEAGPLTLQVKLYPADRAEPAGYLATFKVADVVTVLGGIDHSDPALDHAVLLAAIGSSASSLDISNFSVCPIPRNQKHVRCLICVRQEDGTVIVTWNNPSDAEDKPIKIAVNGELVATVNGTETTHTITNPPEGALTIEVTNYSSIAATCTVCENNPPEVVIDAPGQVELQGGTATIPLDSNASTDGDDGSQTLGRFWEIVAAPQGGNASLDDPGAVIANMNVNADGEYTVRLTITDSGCEGDPGKSAIGERTVTVGPVVPPGGSQRPGDCNQDGKLDISDAICLLGHLFLGDPTTVPCEGGAITDPGNISLLDSNGGGKVDLSDAVSVLTFLFSSGNPPALGTVCVGIVGCPDACS